MLLPDYIESASEHVCLAQLRNSLYAWTLLLIYDFASVFEERQDTELMNNMDEGAWSLPV